MPIITPVQSAEIDRRFNGQASDHYAINAVIEVNLGLISLGLFLIRLETWLRRVHLTHLLCKRALTGWRLISLPDQEL